MPKATGELHLLDLNINAFLSSLDKELTSILVKGTVEWVRTMDLAIPLWSGMSRGSLQKIAGLAGVSLFANPVPRAPNRRQAGELLEGDSELFTNNDNSGRYFMFWQSRVPHLVFNETNNANLVGFHLKSPGPYDALRRGQEAFFKTVNPLLRAIRPNVVPFIRVTRRNVR